MFVWFFGGRECGATVRLRSAYHGGRPQELSNGVKIFVGGFESIDSVCLDNPLGITHVVDCRGGYPRNRKGEWHQYRLPAGVASVNVRWTYLGRLPAEPVARQCLEPLANLLRQGRKSMLIACVNGRHRSAQLAALVLATAYHLGPGYRELRPGLAVDQGCNHVWRARSLSEFCSLRGRCGGGGGLRVGVGRVGRFRSLRTFFGGVSANEASTSARGGFMRRHPRDTGLR